MRKLVISLFFIFILLVGCSRSEQGTYPAALMWNGVIYNPSINTPIEESTVDEELGKIEKQVQPMPKKDGQINDTSNFSLGQKIFSIKNVEVTEAIAIMKGSKCYRIDRIRSSLGIVWGDKIYDFQGNFENENENIDKELGKVRQIGIDYSNSTNGDITTSGYIGDLSMFSVGARICSIKNTSVNNAIAVEGTDGKFHKALYVKELKK